MSIEFNGVAGTPTQLRQFRESLSSGYVPLAASEAAMIALDYISKGMRCLRTDDTSGGSGGTLYECYDLPSSTASNWGRVGGGTVSVGSASYLILPGGSLMPLIFLSGDREESDVVGVRRSTLLIDAGGDNHAQLLWTPNCTLAGNPLTPDDALASTRFANYATSSDVFATGIDGASTSQQYLILVPSGVSMIHFALAGAGSYTADADHQFGGSTMGHMKFPDHDTSPVTALIVTLLSSYTTGRYREISVHPYSGAVQ